MAGEVMINHGRDITTNNVTLEVLTQNSDCHNGLCHLAEELKEQVTFLTPDPTKTLIGFKGKEAFWDSLGRITDVLSKFSNQFQAKVINA